MWLAHSSPPFLTTLPTYPPTQLLPTYLAMYLHTCKLQTIHLKGTFWLTDLKTVTVSFKVAFSAYIPLMKS
jgi:hypothetical protein